MGRAHVYRPITADNGDLLRGARVLVRESGLSVPIAQTLYAGPTGTETLANPHIAASGTIDFWVEKPQRVSVLVTASNHSDILVYLDAAPPPEETARTDTPLLITGERVPGYVLTAGETPNQAKWGPAPTSSGVTPLVSVINERFSLGQDPAGWTFIKAATTTRDYATAVPDGQGLQRSLHAVHTGDSGSLVVRSPQFTLQEPGYVSLWLRPNMASGEQIALAVTSQGGTTTTLETITGIRDWGFYRYPVAAGTYQHMSVEFTGGTYSGSVGHEMWVTGMRAVYGGQVPTHGHPGDGADSILLGTSAYASGVGAIAIGSGSSATAANAVALGKSAQAGGAGAVAVGNAASAPSDSSVALGGQAAGNLAVTGWTAVGKGAYVDSADGVAVGRAAQVYAADGVAVGRDSYVGSNASSGLAIGTGALARGNRSAAIGSGSSTGTTHVESVALGYQARTTAAHQVMLGNPSLSDSSVIIPGRLYAVGSVNLGSDPASRLGFYGAEGTVRPVVSGSDGGVLALRNLISALAGLGLITNSTTA